MKKYCVDISLKDDSKNYSIIGYEGQKKSDVNEHLGFFLKDRQLELGKNNSDIFEILKMKKVEFKEFQNDDEKAIYWAKSPIIKDGFVLSTKNFYNLTTKKKMPFGLKKIPYMKP